ncbi:MULTISPECIES: hypothetical protein [Salinibaculum]|uniref:hypothetical protein n=1 Tax=Salinibaculum TaxID=2732368 RepID=UPI0030CC8397
MKVEYLKDRYSGERIFILGNGPSLKHTPLERLSDEYTFSVNNIANIFDQTDWHPSFYLGIHSPPSIPKKNIMKMVNLDIPCFLPMDDLNFVPDRDNTMRLTLKNLVDMDKVDISVLDVNWESVDDFHDIWSIDVTDIVYHYTTVLYPVMQLAHYMGFSEFYLLGCDMYDEWNLHMLFDKGDDPALFRSDKPTKIGRIYEFFSSAEYPLRSCLNGVAYELLDSVVFRKAQPHLMKIDDCFANPAHFYDTYDVGQYLAGNKRRNKEICQSHELAREASSKLGFNIYNATLGGDLEVHPRVDLYDLLNIKRPPEPETTIK